jgi:hypothetical protein
MTRNEFDRETRVLRAAIAVALFGAYFTLSLIIFS